MAKRRVNNVVLSQSQRVNLITGRNCGGVGPGWAFETERARLAAWEANAEELIATSRPGRRPAAWWDYDAEGQRMEAQRIPHETDLQLLYRLDALTEEEAAQLAEWSRLPPEPATGADPRELLWSGTFPQLRNS